MPKKPNVTDWAARLRERVRDYTGQSLSTPDAGQREADGRSLLHELEVQQIELEMQNAELRVARDEAEAILDKYTDLYDFAPVGYFTLSSEGVVRLVNLNGSMLVGVERSKLKGRTFQRLISPAQRPEFMDFLGLVFASETTQSSDFELVLPDHSLRQVNIEARRSAEGNECGALVLDITSRKLAEDQVRVSEIRYRRLFEAANDGVLLVDPGTRKITDANPFMTQLLGYSREELIGKELYEIGLLKDEPASREMFRNLKKDHQVRYEDLPLKSQTGRHQEVEVVANLYREGNKPVIQCNIRDITARKQEEGMLHRNQALFSAVIEQAPVGVYVVDSMFRLQQANPMAMDVFGNIHPLINRDFAEIVRSLWLPKVANGIIREFRNTLETGDPFQSPSLAERRRDTGAREVYEWQIQRVMLPDGGYGVVCFFNNITERTLAETARRRLEVLTASNLKLKMEIVRRQVIQEALRKTRHEQSQLLRQSRLQQKEMRDLSRRMLSVQEDERKRISRELHDVIAQTLVGINVHLAALAQGSSSDVDNLRKQIADTHLLVEKAVEIVHQFARELRPTMLDDLGLIPALGTVMKSFMEETGIRVSLSATPRIEETASTVRTVLFRIAQEALTNVERHAQASHVEVVIVALERGFRMTIRDNGKGFKPGSVAVGKKNTRLGLLGMRERIEMIGGTFRIDSTPGESTTVEVVIPPAKDSVKHGPSLEP